MGWFRRILRRLGISKKKKDKDKDGKAKGKAKTKSAPNTVAEVKITAAPKGFPPLPPSKGKAQAKGTLAKSSRGPAPAGKSSRGAAPAAKSSRGPAPGLSDKPARSNRSQVRRVADGAKSAPVKGPPSARDPPSKLLSLTASHKTQDKSRDPPTQSTGPSSTRDDKAPGPKAPGPKAKAAKVAPAKEQSKAPAGGEKKAASSREAEAEEGKKKEDSDSLTHTLRTNASQRSDVGDLARVTKPHARRAKR